MTGQKIFINNLFAAKAINGSNNPSNLGNHWNDTFHSVSYGIFFTNMSKKISARHAANILKFIGAVTACLVFLIVAHTCDKMITISSTLFLVGLFYITVFILKTKLHLLKLSCIICLLTFYYTLYLYGSGNWGLLAIMQKISLISSMLLVLGLEYFTNQEDFKQIKPNERTKNTNNEPLALLLPIVGLAVETISIDNVSS